MILEILGHRILKTFNNFIYYFHNNENIKVINIKYY
jgi:hypothetical protein